MFEQVECGANEDCHCTTATSNRTFYSGSLLCSIPALYPSIALIAHLDRELVSGASCSLAGGDSVARSICGHGWMGERGDGNTKVKRKKVESEDQEGNIKVNIAQRSESKMQDVM